MACGHAPSITRETLPGYDYAAFTGQAPNDGPPQPLRLADPAHRITVQQLQERCGGVAWLTAFDPVERRRVGCGWKLGTCP